MACRIADYTKPEWILPKLLARTKEDVLRELAQLVSTQVSSISEIEIYQRLLEREQKASTGADHGLAIPHATIASADSLMIVVARSDKGIDFGALDSQFSYVFFAVINPAKSKPGETSYLQAISAICRFMRQPQMRQRIMEASSGEDIFNVISKEEAPRSGI